MAVYGGARLRTGALPTSGAATRRSPGPSAPSWSAPRIGPVGLLIAAILAGTMLGLVYLTQTLGSNATSSEIGDLAAKSIALDRSLDTQALTVELYMKPQDIAKRARKQGLVELRAPLVLPAP